MNKVTLIGRLVDKVEAKDLKDDLVVANFTVAINSFNKDVVNFINCVAFDKLADVLDEYSYKGMQVAVHGSLQTRNYENKEGKKVYVTEVLAREIEFLGSRPDRDLEPKEVFKGPNDAIEKEPVRKTGSYRTRK